MSNRMILYAGSCALAFAQAGTAFAQTSDGGRPDEGTPTSQAADGTADIIVTAQKYSQSVNNVPMTITVATSEQLEEAGIRTVEDLVKITPGFNVTQTPTGQSVYTLRGIGFNDSSLGTRPAVTVYMDEAPIPFGLMTRGASLDLDHVEVLKGPQGTLFGANSTGGAINYITAKPTSSFTAGGSATYGRFDQFDVSGFVSGPLSDTLSVRLAVEHQGSGDWQKSITRDDTAGQKNFSNGRVSLLWEPVAPLRILLTAQRWVDRSDALVGQAFAFDPQVPAFAAATGVQNYPYGIRGSRFADWDPDSDLARNNKFTMLTGRLDYELSDAITFTSLTNYIDFKYHLLSEADGVPVHNTTFITDSTNETFSQELRLSGKFGNLRAIVGANYEHDTPSESTLQDLSTASAIVSLSQRFGGGVALRTLRVVANQKTDIYAIFGNLEYEIAPGLVLQGGARYTRSKIAFNGCLADSGDGTAAPSYTGLINATRAARGLAPIAPLRAGDCVTMDASTNPPTLTPGLVTTPYDEDNVSWRAGVQYNLATNAMVYANVSKGYKMGGHPFVNSTFSTALTPATQESLLAYEGGFKAGLFNRALQLNGAVFYYDYTNKQEVGTIVDPVIGRIGALTNIPKSRVYGAELQVDAAPYEGLTLQAGGVYVRTEILDHYTSTNAAGATQDFDGTELANAPRWQINASARYEWELTERLNMFVSGRFYYQSTAQDRIGNVPGYQHEAYKLVDLSAGVESPGGKWRAYVWGRNVFNERYGLTRNGIDTNLYYMAKPATYGITVGFNY